MLESQSQSQSLDQQEDPINSDTDPESEPPESLEARKHKLRMLLPLLTCSRDVDSIAVITSSVAKLIDFMEDFSVIKLSRQIGNVPTTSSRHSIRHKIHNNKTGQSVQKQIALHKHQNINLGTVTSNNIKFHLNVYCLKNPGSGTSALDWRPFTTCGRVVIAAAMNLARMLQCGRARQLKIAYEKYSLSDVNDQMNKEEITNYLDEKIEKEENRRDRTPHWISGGEVFYLKSDTTKYAEISACKTDALPFFRDFELSFTLVSLGILGCGEIWERSLEMTDKELARSANLTTRDLKVEAQTIWAHKAFTLTAAGTKHDFVKHKNFDYIPKEDLFRDLERNCDAIFKDAESDFAVWLEKAGKHNIANVLRCFQNCSPGDINNSNHQEDYESGRGDLFDEGVRVTVDDALSFQMNDVRKMLVPASAVCATKESADRTSAKGDEGNSVSEIKSGEESNEDEDEDEDDFSVAAAKAMLEAVVKARKSCDCGHCFEDIHPQDLVQQQEGWAQEFTYGNDLRVRQRDLAAEAPDGCDLDNGRLLPAAKKLLAAAGVEYQAGQSLVLLWKRPGTPAQLWHVDRYLAAQKQIQNTIVPITEWRRADTLRGGKLDDVEYAYHGGSQSVHGAAGLRQPGMPYTFRGDQVHRGAANPSEDDRYALFLTTATNDEDGTQGVTLVKWVQGRRKKKAGGKYEEGGGYTIVDRPRRLSQRALDQMASRDHPLRATDFAAGLCGEDLREPSCPVGQRPGPQQKEFRGADQVSATYQQVVVETFDMRGSAPQREGQCFLPAVTFAAGTVRATHPVWRDLATDVSFEDIKSQVYRQGYVLTDHYFSTPVDFFTKVTTGMWVMWCEFRGCPHWLAYSGWNAALYEPALDRLLLLDRGDFADEGRIDQALAKLEISAMVCYGQLWCKVASAGRKKRRRGGGRGGGKRPRQDGS